MLVYLFVVMVMLMTQSWRRNTPCDVQELKQALQKSKAGKKIGKKVPREPGGAENEGIL